MEVKNLKELANLIKILRKNGVDAFESGDLKLSLGPLPIKQKQPKRSSTEVTDPVQLDLPQYSDLDMALWSSGSLPIESN